MPSTLSKEQKKKNNEEVDKLFQKKRLEASLLIIGAAHFSFFFDWSSGLDSFQHILTTLSNNNSAVQTSYVSNIDSMSAIASVFVTPYWGDLCDRYGRKPLLLASPLIACVCNILFAYSPSWTTVFLKKFSFSCISLPMFRLAAECSMSDCASGPDLAYAMSRFNTYMGLSMIPGSYLGPYFRNYFGAKGTLYVGTGIIFLGGYCLPSLLYKETMAKKANNNNDNDADSDKKKIQRKRVGISTFLKVFRDPLLLKYSILNSLHFIMDGTMEIDQIYNRVDVGLNPSERGIYMSLRGVAYFIGTTFARVFQRKLGPLGYTQIVHYILMLSFLIKANMRSMRMVIMMLMCYSCAPMYIRSSAMNSLYYKRGLELGFTRGTLSAATSSLMDFCKIISPLIYARIYNYSTFKGTPYYFAFCIVIVSEIIRSSLVV